MKTKILSYRFTFKVIILLIITLNLADFSNLISTNTPKPKSKSKSKSSGIKLHKTLSEIFHKKERRPSHMEMFDANLKLSYSQINQIFSIFLVHNNKHVDPHSLRAVRKIFIKDFASCDKNKDNVLNFKEFMKCINTSKYLKIFHLSSKTQQGHMMKIVQENKKWTNVTNTASLGKVLFETLDENENRSLNFYEYMVLRLFSFSLRKCSSEGYFLDKSTFECALDIIVKNYHSFASKSLFNFALQLSNIESHKDLDIPTFLLTAVSLRLYARINTKQDGYMTRRELSAASDLSILPKRYTQDILDSFFSLVSSKYKKESTNGVDPLSFTFIDIMLRLFTKQNGGKVNKLTFTEFKSVLRDYTFPKKILTEFFLIPKFYLKKENYRMFMEGKIEKFFNEKTFLFNNIFRFKEKPKVKNVEIKKNSTTTKTTTIETSTTIRNSTSPYGYLLNKLTKRFNFDFATENVFNIMDYSQKGYTTFQEFMYFIQAFYLYYRYDPQQKGKLTAGVLKSELLKYSGYPLISFNILSQVKEFKILQDDIRINPFYAYAILRTKDISRIFIRKDYYNSLINEVNLSRMLKIIYIPHFPDEFIEKCIVKLHTTDPNINVPEYDLNCVLPRVFTIVSVSLETYLNKQIVKKEKIKLVNTDINKNNLIL